MSLSFFLKGRLRLVLLEFKMKTPEQAICDSQRLLGKNGEKKVSRKRNLLS